MPIDKSIQEKVLKIAANKAVNNKTKLEVRKQFYALKQSEIEVEAQEEDLNSKAAEFNNLLNEILAAISSIPQLDIVDNQEEKYVAPPTRQVQNVQNSFKQNTPQVMDTMDDDGEEEIVMPQNQQKFAGVKVRMQEENTDVEEDTDFEVPFEAEEK